MKQTASYPPPGVRYHVRRQKRTIWDANTHTGNYLGQPSEVYDGLEVMFDGQAYRPEHDEARMPQIPSEVYEGWDGTLGVAGIWKKDML